MKRIDCDLFDKTVWIYVCCNIEIEKGVRGGKEIDIHGRCVVVRNVML